MSMFQTWMKLLSRVAHAVTKCQLALIALSACCIILLSACSVSSEVSPSSAAPAQENSVGQPALPGTEEFGLTRQGLVEAIESVEALIAVCMSDAGFEYVAVDYNTARRAMTSDKSLPGMGERQFISQYGFGISTLYTGRPPQLSDLDVPAKIGLDEQNVRIFNSLAPADQVAYSRSLLGENVDATFAVAIETKTFSRTGGCTRKAIEQIFTEEQIGASYVSPKDVLFEQDPRMIAAIAKFSECMLAEGFEYGHERDIEPDIRSKLEAITAGKPLAALSPDEKKALAQLQTAEIAIAIATAACESKYIDPIDSTLERELYTGRQG